MSHCAGACGGFQPCSCASLKTLATVNGTPRNLGSALSKTAVLLPPACASHAAHRARPVTSGMPLDTWRSASPITLVALCFPWVADAGMACMDAHSFASSADSVAVFSSTDWRGSCGTALAWAGRGPSNRSRTSPHDFALHESCWHLNPSAPDALRKIAASPFTCSALKGHAASLNRSLPSCRSVVYASPCRERKSSRLKPPGWRMGVVGAVLAFVAAGIRLCSCSGVTTARAGVCNSLESRHGAIGVLSPLFASVP